MSRTPLTLFGPSRKAPLDVRGLRAHCQQRVAAGEAAETVDLLLDLVEALAARVEQLEQRVARMAQAQWGRQSERLSKAQLALALGESSPQAALPPAADENARADGDGDSEPPAPARRLARKKTRQIPAHIPRVTILSEPSEAQRMCSGCGHAKHLIGSESSEVLEWEPGGFRVEVTERRKYACRDCESGVVMGPGPSRVLPQAMPGAGLLAEVVVRKIKDSCPLDRQSRIFSERFGVPLSPSTLGDWLAGTADVLAPIARRLREQGLQSTHLSFDDTPIRVLDPAHPNGVKRGHLWSFVSDAPLVFYEYTPTWSGGPIQTLLSDYVGTLQSDGYSGVNALYKKESAPTRAGCLAHARRKFHVAYQAGDLRAAGPLRVIQRLYAIERRAKHDGCDAAERQRRRQAESQPLMQRLHDELQRLGAQAPPKTPLGQAITYALRQWPTLTVFVHDGAQRIDNNHTERTLRPVAIGRKNWLFAGSDDGARRLAILYTLVGSAEQAGLRDPWHYLRDVLHKLSQGWLHSRLDDLLPLSWQATHPG